MAEEFAKIFDVENVGQILVLHKGNEDNAPEVRFFLNPEGLGVCSLAVTASDTDGGWTCMEELFDSMDEEKALAGVKPMLGLLTEN